jgi:glycosyltransferase involved in cell wall biosynthesis
MKSDLTVIVPCHGRELLTRRILDSFTKSNDSFKIIIVDDGSPISLQPLVLSYADRLELDYVRLERSQGPAKARNVGIARATTELIAFTDNDCVVHPDWSHQLATTIQKASPMVAGVGGRVLAVGNDLISRYYSYHKILDPFLFDGGYLYLVTANCVFRRLAVQMVGGFDEDIDRPGGEDPGLCFKLLQRGLNLEYQPNAIVWHEYRQSLWDFARTFFRYGRGCRLQADRYGREIRTLTEPESTAAPAFGR